MYYTGLSPKIKVNGGDMNSKKGWKGSSKSSCLLWLRMEIMTLVTTKTGIFYLTMTCGAFQKLNA